MCSYMAGQPNPMMREIPLACVAMAVAVVLCLLHGVNLVRHSLNILCLIGRDFLDALVLPMDVFPVRHCIMIFAFV